MSDGNDASMDPVAVVGVAVDCYEGVSKKQFMKYVSKTNRRIDTYMMVARRKSGSR